MRSTILMIGNDSGLTYLIGRYAEQGGFGIAAFQVAPAPIDVRALHPVAVLFQSVEIMEVSGVLIRALTDCDVPILVCSSLTDEARARELGADRCLLHPLTYERVLAALAVTHA